MMVCLTTDELRDIESIVIKRRKANRDEALLRT